jgi:hypothetical protein
MANAGDLINTLTIANPTTVTLSNTDHTASTLNLQSGLFAAGVNQTLRIAAGGTVNGNGYNSYTGNQVVADASGGTIQFLGNGAVMGTPELYNITIGNSGVGVNFTNNARIHNLFTINNLGSVISNAPRYAIGSTLVYNAGGTYARNIEWGNTAVNDNPGYPWHVTVQNGTILDLRSNDIFPPYLGLGGDLTIGSGTTKAEVYLNNNMEKRLVVGGNLIIGGGAAIGSILRLGDAFGGDLEIGGNYTRTSNGTFNPNNRAVFFTGSTPASINNAGGTETFPFVIVDKANSPTPTLTLNTPVNISQKFTLSSGRVITTAINILSITNREPDDIANGVSLNTLDANPGYVDGPMRRNVRNTIYGERYLFPVGKRVATTDYYKRFWMQDIENSNNPDQYFLGEYVRQQPPGSGEYLFQSILKGILAREYWNVNNENAGARGRLVLPYTNPGVQGWLDVNKNLITPPTNTNVAIVRVSLLDQVGPG